MLPLALINQYRNIPLIRKAHLKIQYLGCFSFYLNLFLNLTDTAELKNTL